MGVLKLHADWLPMSHRWERRKLAALAELEAVEAEIAERVTTIADEAFGPFPVQSTDESLTAIEAGIFEMRKRAVNHRCEPTAPVDTFPRPPRDEAEREACRRSALSGEACCATEPKHGWYCTLPRAHDGITLQPSRPTKYAPAGPNRRSTRNDPPNLNR